MSPSKPSLFAQGLIALALASIRSGGARLRRAFRPGASGFLALAWAALSLASWAALLSLPDASPRRYHLADSAALPAPGSDLAQALPQAAQGWSVSPAPDGLSLEGLTPVSDRRKEALLLGLQNWRLWGREDAQALRVALERSEPRSGDLSRLALRRALSDRIPGLGGLAPGRLEPGAAALDHPEFRADCMSEALGLLAIGALILAPMELLLLARSRPFFSRAVCRLGRARQAVEHKGAEAAAERLARSERKALDAELPARASAPSRSSRV